MVHARGPEESILLIRRAERQEDPWSGHWSFPGGRRDRDDADPLHTALRELEEECGIRLARPDMEAALPPTVARRRTGPFLLVAPFVFRVERELATVLDPREAAESRWIPLSLLRDPTRHSLSCVPGRPREMLFPAIALDGGPLWGFTYRLITDWLGLGSKQQPESRAGLEVASRLLDFVLSHGLKLEHGWIERSAQPGTPGGEGVRAAAVTGAIPVMPVLAHFSVPGPHVMAVNCLDVQSGHIRLVGPAFEEYFIYGSG